MLTVIPLIPTNVSPPPLTVPSPWGTAAPKPPNSLPHSHCSNSFGNKRERLPSKAQVLVFMRPAMPVIHYQHFSLVTSLFGVPDFLHYVFLIYHNLKCFKSLAHSDTTMGKVFQWNLRADSFSLPSDTRGLCNLGITELLKLMAEGQGILLVTLYIMLWFSKRVAGLFWFFTPS